MSQVRVRLKHQITIPIRIAEAAHIKPDDMLEVAYANGIITLVPVNRMARKESVMGYAGIARGIWGKTTFEIEAGLNNDRESWER
jgi:AbrB family looped-hinge helix DNA binding protein